MAGSYFPECFYQIVFDWWGVLAKDNEMQVRSICPASHAGICNRLARHYPASLDYPV